LLYGEGGEKAFIRLQEELLKISDDQSLFVWGTVDPRVSYGGFVGGLLAKSPASFTRFGNVVTIQRFPGSSKPTSVTNKGVQLSIPLISGWSSVVEPYKSYMGLLDCQFEGDLRGQVGILLFKRDSGDYRYLRALVDPKIVPLRRLLDATEKTVHVKDIYEEVKGGPKPQFPSFFVIPAYARNSDYKLFDVFPRERWNEDEGLFMLQHGRHETHHVVFSYRQDHSRAAFVVLLQYSCSATGMIDSVNKIEISRDLGTSLKSLHENYRYRSFEVNNKMRTISPIEINGVIIQIDIRTTSMLNKSLWLICISAKNI